MINTWVHKARCQDGVHSTIVSSDKDLKQLLSQAVEVFDPMKNKTTRYHDFLKEFGFEPHLLADYLALVGDSSDNVPGVPGIGPKSASELIKKYGSLDEMYANIEHITGALQKKLLA